MHVLLSWFPFIKNVVRSSKSEAVHSLASNTITHGAHLVVHSHFGKRELVLPFT